jgi:hypothetical protein
MRTDSKGTVYLFWQDAQKGKSIHVMARSFDGGAKFERSRTVANVVDVGAFDPVQGSFTFDGVAGARTDSFPSVDIANGAPYGNGPDTIVLAWSDGRNGLGDEQALLQYSEDGGETWVGPIDGAQAGDRPNFPWVAISPDGGDVYLTYNAFTDLNNPWRNDLTGPRPFQGVLRHAKFGTLNQWTTYLRGLVGDARASSANSLAVEFLGDYNSVDATNDGAVAVWNDGGDAAVCTAVNTYRAGLASGAAVAAPAPDNDCPSTFGNTDIYGAFLVEPTP